MSATVVHFPEPKPVPSMLDLTNVPAILIKDNLPSRHRAALQSLTLFGPQLIGPQHMTMVTLSKLGLTDLRKFHAGNRLPSQMRWHLTAKGREVAALIPERWLPPSLRRPTHH